MEASRCAGWQSLVYAGAGRGSGCRAGWGGLGGGPGAQAGAAGAAGAAGRRLTLIPRQRGPGCVKGGYSYSEKGAEDLPVALEVPVLAPLETGGFGNHAHVLCPHTPSTASQVHGHGHGRGTSQSRTPRATSASAVSASTGSSVSRLKPRRPSPLSWGWWACHHPGPSGGGCSQGGLGDSAMPSVGTVRAL